MSENKPIIGISMGDPASIGPEVIVKSVAMEEKREISKTI